MFSCQSGLKGFAIIKFPQAKSSRAGRITCAEKPHLGSLVWTILNKKSPYPKPPQKDIFHHGICTPVPLGLYFMGILVISWHPAVHAGWNLGFQCSWRRKLLFAPLWGRAAPGHGSAWEGGGSVPQLTAPGDLGRTNCLPWSILCLSPLQMV